MWLHGSLFVTYVLYMCGCSLYSQIVVNYNKIFYKSCDENYSKM